MSDERPAPMTPTDCDLRGYEFMPLFGHRLFSSDLYMRASAVEFRAAVRLWWSAWQQCPAGSLPNDDVALTILCDLGRDMKSFVRIKSVALEGFVECQDGRLYHPLLAAAATSAYARRLKERERKQRLRAKDDPQPDLLDGVDMPGPDGGLSASCPAGQTQDGTRSVRVEGEGDIERKKERDIGSLRSPHPAAAGEGRAKAVPKVRDGRDYSADFLLFWHDYPRKVDKPAAWKAWQAAERRGGNYVKLLEALEVVMPEWGKRDPEKIPHPATWINRDPWDVSGLQFAEGPGA